MESNDDLSSLLRPKLDERLKSLLKEISLTPLSRIPSERIERTALKHIASIESVSGPEFRERYQELYESSFHGGERERSDLIVSRLEDEFRNARSNLAPYHVIGLRDIDGNAIGAAQFSVLFIPRPTGLVSLAVPYLQYIYIDPSHRRQDLSEVLHTLVLAVATADGRRHWGGGVEVEVPYTLCETEPPVHGSDIALQAKAKERAGIHTKSGSIALMLRDPQNHARLVSSHVQPGLELDDPPITLIWILRSNPALGTIALEDQQVGVSLLEAYYRSLRDEGFSEDNIQLAESMVEGRRHRGHREFCLLEIGDVTKAMYVGIDQD